MYRNDEKIEFPNNKKDTGDTYIHDEFMKEIMSYLDQREAEDQPFFLHYAALIPHASLVVPEQWLAKYRDKVTEEEPGSFGRHYAKCQEPKATFAGMINRLDWEVGEIMKKLEDLGMAENTLVIVASDNGPHQEGGKLAEWLNSNNGLRGHKRDLFEGGVRVPMIAYWPGSIKAGSVSNHLSAFWDVMPTLCELTGATAPEGIDGISFLADLLGEEGQKQHDYLYWEYSKKRAALTHKWKVVQEGRSPMMLFAAADLYEKNDVASQYPEVVDKFNKIFKEAHTPKRASSKSRKKK